MNFNLTPQLEDLVRSKIISGRYDSASEVVREVLRRFARWHWSNSDTTSNKAGKAVRQANLTLSPSNAEAGSGWLLRNSAERKHSCALPVRFADIISIFAVLVRGDNFVL